MTMPSGVVDAAAEVLTGRSSQHEGATTAPHLWVGTPHALDRSSFKLLNE
jgi:hypothetical protein